MALYVFVWAYFRLLLPPCRADLVSWLPRVFRAENWRFALLNVGPSCVPAQLRKDEKQSVVSSKDSPHCRPRPFDAG
jgi:hypothetical protein